MYIYIRGPSYISLEARWLRWGSMAPWGILFHLAVTDKQLSSDIIFLIVEI